MIQSFKDGETYNLFVSRKSRRWSNCLAAALRKLDQIEASIKLEDLSIPPGNRLELLKGDRAGQHSIRINKKWRICFRWQEAGAADVEIVDYH